MKEALDKVQFRQVQHLGKQSSYVVVPKPTLRKHRIHNSATSSTQGAVQDQKSHNGAAQIQDNTECLLTKRHQVVKDLCRYAGVVC